MADGSEGEDRVDRSVTRRVGGPKAADHGPARWPEERPLADPVRMAQGRLRGTALGVSDERHMATDARPFARRTRRIGVPRPVGGDAS